MTPAAFQRIARASKESWPAKLPCVMWMKARGVALPWVCGQRFGGQGHVRGGGLSVAPWPAADPERTGRISRRSSPYSPSCLVLSKHSVVWFLLLHIRWTYLRTSVSLLGMSDPDAPDSSHEANLRKAMRLMAQIPLIIANAIGSRTGNPAGTASGPEASPKICCTCWPAGEAMSWPQQWPTCSMCRSSSMRNTNSMRPRFGPRDRLDDRRTCIGDHRGHRHIERAAPWWSQ